MAFYGDHAQAPLLTERFSGNLGQGNGEAAPAEPFAPNRNPPPVVAEQQVRDLPCPVCVGNPGWYSKVKYKCVQGKTYKGLSKLNEHINRVHSEESLCPTCIKTIPVHQKGCNPVKNREEHPTFLAEDVILKVRKWNDGPKDSSDLVVGRWKFIFKLINSREPTVHELVAFSQSPSSQSTSSQSTSSQLASSQLAFSQPVFSWRSSELRVPLFPAPPRTKRQASSSPNGKQPGSRRRQTNSQAQAADKGAEAVRFSLATAGSNQPQPDGHRDVPFGRQSHGMSNLQQDFYSRYHVDHKRDLDIDPRMLDNAANTWRTTKIPTDAQSWDQSETTAVTGPHLHAYTGSTARSETNGFLAHEDQSAKAPLYVLEEGDDLPPFGDWSSDILWGCEQQEGRSGASELVPGAHYVETLEGEADVDLFVPAEE